MRILSPHLYQGNRNYKHRKGYFEGWYFKLTDRGNRALAVIPGVSITAEGPRGFIQTIDGVSGETTFTPFPVSEVRMEDSPFCVSLGKNIFSLDGMELGDRIPLGGNIKFVNPRLYRTSLTRPGIMGWYRYLPFMECYHGVVSTNHGIEGKVELHGESIDFTGGKGYIEKDWGTSFPSSYMWMQSNSFMDERVSFMLSVAKIPWMGSWFRGFLGFLDTGDEIITFATHTGAVVEMISFDDKALELKITGKGKGQNNSLAAEDTIEVKAHRGKTGILMAPQSGLMDRRISESIDAQIELVHKREGKILFEGKTHSSGLELVGSKTELGFS